MAAYVQALQNFRKQLLSSAQPVEAPVPQRGGGILSSPNVKAAQQQTEQSNQLRYEPSKFVLNGMREVGIARQRMQQALAKGKQVGYSLDKKAEERKARASSSVEATTPTEETPVEAKGLISKPADGPKGKEVYTRQMPGNTAVLEDTAFVDKAKGLAKKYNVPVSHLMSVMHFETGGSFDPAQKNAGGSSATGLIQFMSSTAKGLGTSTDALSKMSRLEQLDWVDKYFETSGLSKVKNPTGEDLYMSVLWPAAVGKPSDTILWKEGSEQYAANKGLDSTGKGYVTKADAARKAMQYVDAYGELNG